MHRVAAIAHAVAPPDIAVAAPLVAVAGLCIVVAGLCIAVAASRIVVAAVVVATPAPRTAVATPPVPVAAPRIAAAVPPRPPGRGPPPPRTRQPPQPRGVVADSIPACWATVRVRSWPPRPSRHGATGALHEFVPWKADGPPSGSPFLRSGCLGCGYRITRSGQISRRMSLSLSITSWGAGFGPPISMSMRVRSSSPAAMLRKEPIWSPRSWS